MNYKIFLVDSATGADRVFWILAPPITIGRSSAADVSIGDDSISRRHCQLSLDAQEALVVRDLDSMNGTYVDDQRVTKKILKPGDVIRIGAITLRIEWTDEEVVTTPAVGDPCDVSTTQPMKTFSLDELKRKFTER